MNAFSLRFFIFVFLMSFSVMASAQRLIYKKITPWKNNAKGVYTLIHDDFGMDAASGIENYADTIAYNRSIRFSFGPVTSHCDKKDWKNANRLISHGHEIINHSHSHFCGMEKDWCIWGNWSEKDFPLEIDSSSALIYQNTGVHPGFFIFPYDLYTDTMVNYLRTRPYYYGARAGYQEQLMKSSLIDPFRVNFTVFRPEYSFSVLDSFVTKSIREKSWGVRVVHGVNDQSWGSISLEAYRKHLDFVRSKMESGDLWVAPVQDVILYEKAMKSYSLEADTLTSRAGHNHNKITVTFTPVPGVNEITDAELTVFIEVKYADNPKYDLSKSKIIITQNGKMIQPLSNRNNTTSLVGENSTNVILFNANPANGRTIEINIQ